MDKDMHDKFNLLRTFSDDLARKAKATLPLMEDILDGKTEIIAGCPDKETAAAMELRGIEKYLAEAVSAFVGIQQALTPETTSRHIFIHTCTSANRLQGTVSFWWDRPPSDEDKTEARALGRLFGSDS